MTHMKIHQHSKSDLGRMQLGAVMTSIGYSCPTSFILIDKWCIKSFALEHRSTSCAHCGGFCVLIHQRTTKWSCRWSCRWTQSVWKRKGSRHIEGDTNFATCNGAYLSPARCTPGNRGENKIHPWTRPFINSCVCLAGHAIRMSVIINFQNSCACGVNTVIMME